MSNGTSRDWDRGNPDCMRSTYPLPGFPRARLSLTSISGPSFLVLVPRRPATVSNRCPDAIPVVMPQTFTENEALWCGAQFGLGLTSTRLDSRNARPRLLRPPLPPAWSSRRLSPALLIPVTFPRREGKNPIIGPSLFFLPFPSRPRLPFEKAIPPYISLALIITLSSPTLAPVATLLPSLFVLFLAQHRT